MTFPPIEVYRTRYAVKQSTDDVVLDTVTSGRFDESSITFDEPPRAVVVAQDESGVLGASLLTEGMEIEIRRGVNGTQGELRFKGIIEAVEAEDGAQGCELTVRSVHKGYKVLQQRLCDTYDFDEDDDPSTTRDAVTINPWNYFIFRQAGGPLDSRGDVLPIDGIRFDDVIRCLIGTKFIHQIDFVDNSYLLASQVYATTNAAQVHRDGSTGDLRPKLQRVRSSGTGFAAGGSIETIPLISGSALIDVMGDISQVTVTLIGEAINGNPTVAASRNALDAVRSYSAGKTVASTNVLYDNAITDTGLDKWVYTFSNVELPNSANKNALGIKITLPGGAGDATTTKIHYMKVECVTASDTGLNEGTIETYVNPISLRDDIDPSDWIETDLSEKNRLEAGEVIRQLTESDSASNPSPHWDLWIDANLTIHFVERRGNDISDHEYSFPNGNLRTVRHDKLGNELAFQTIAYGAGSGTAQTRIVSKEEFSTGGLYDSDRDPGVGALYGQLARIVKFVDENETSPIALYRKARAYHKLHRDPIENIQVEIEPEFIRYFDTGDSIQVKNIRTRTHGLLRVVGLSRAWDGGDMEKLSVTLGQPLDDFGRSISNNTQRHETLVVRPKPGDGMTGLSGDGIHFDKDHYGVYAFPIQDGASVDRVLLKITTVPWQSNARSITEAAGGASALPNRTLDTDVDVAAHEVGEQTPGTLDLDDKNTTGTANAQTISGSTAVHVPPNGNALYDINVGSTLYAAGASTTTTDATSGGDTTTDENDGFLIEGQFVYANEAAEAQTSEWFIRLILTRQDSTDLDFFRGNIRIEKGGVWQLRLPVFSGYLKRLGWTSVIQIKLIVQNVGAGNQTMATRVMALDGIPTHVHPKGTLANAASTANTVVQNTGLDGETDSKTADPPADIVATTLAALFSTWDRRIGYRADSGGTGAILYTEAAVDYYEEHVHDTTLDFGMYQFDGDSGDGTGAPVFGTGIQFAVDPTIDASGLPTTFATQRHPETFGASGSPQTIEIDVTGYLAVDANGIVKSGEHRGYFKSQAGANNSKGLAVVMVTPILKFRTG